MSRKNQTSELKARVMEAALCHFSEVGIERTSVSNILKDAECSVGSLYHHFGNKEGIAEALFIDGVNQFNSRLLATLLPRRTASTGIKAIVTFCCEWVTARSELAGFLLSREVTLSDKAKLELREMGRAFGQSILWRRLYDLQQLAQHIIRGFDDLGVGVIGLLRNNQIGKLLCHINS